MNKIIYATLIIGLLAIFSNQALAAQPNHQACFGKDISGYATGGLGVGGFFSGLAQATNGIGNEIQAHQAGLVPDSIIPNSCND